MSRIGKKPIPIPQTVKIAVVDRTVTVTGPKGTLTRTVHPHVTVTREGGEGAANLVVNVAHP